jgi:hypothetical protein
MNKRFAVYSNILFEPVTGFNRLKPGDFEQKFEDDVADLNNSLVAVEWRIAHDGVEIIRLSNGYAVAIDRTGRMSLYETEAHHTQRTLLSEWATFVRGSWSDRTPTEPGVYFVRDKDLGRRSVREISRVNGRTVDVSGGNVPWGSVSCWQGQWWSERIPKLPGAY